LDSATQQTIAVVDRFYAAIGHGDGQAIMDCLDPDIVFELPQDQYNSIIPYLGTKRGHQEVAEAFRIRAQTTEVLAYEVRDRVAQGHKACVVVFTSARGRASERPFDIEDVHHLTVNEGGKIARWKVYFDPNAEVAAFRAGINDRLLDAVERSDEAQVRTFLSQGANPNARRAGLTALMLAAGRGDTAVVHTLIANGADVLAVDARAGNSVLHVACQGGSADVVALLLQHGAFVNSICVATGHTPLMDALWYKWPDIVELLLDHKAALNLTTHYGFTLDQHLAYEEEVNVFGKDRFQPAKKLIEKRRQSDQAAIAAQHLMAAVARGDLVAVKAHLAAGAVVDAVYPIVNGFNDGHTPLLVACRDGHREIVAELLKKGANVNFIEPTFGAVPLHKAVYNGHAEITRLLVRQPHIDLNFRGATNGYTPLHDALWHGYRECAEALLSADARVDIRGNDGKLPADIAIEVFGPSDPLVQQLEHKARP
jgi:uncharacterized protein